MQNTEPLTPTAPRPPTLRDEVTEVGPIIGTVFVSGPPVLLAWTGTVLFALMLAGPFALLVTLVLAFAAAAAVVTLAGIILAAPDPLVPQLPLHIPARRQVPEAPRPIATV